METKDQKRPAAGGKKHPAPAKSRKPAARRPEPAAQRRQPRTAAQRKARQAPPRSAQEARQAAEQQRRAAARRRKNQPKTPLPEVVYTPPAPFSRNRLLLKLATVAAVVLALTFGISIFFKVGTITVSGAKSYSPWTVREASGIEEGDNLLTFGEARACGKIKLALPYVDEVRIGIKLPDTVNIEIKEVAVAYSIRDEGGLWWLMTSDGKIMDQADAATAGEYTRIEGVKLSMPSKGQMAVAAEAAPPATDPAETTQAAPDTPSQEATAATAPVSVRGEDRLQALLSILQYLEQNEIIGDVAVIDVTDLSNIELWYGERFQVMLGDTTELSKKIRWLKEAVVQLNNHQSGVLDISLTHWENEVGYTPFA